MSKQIDLSLLLGKVVADDHPSFHVEWKYCQLRGQYTFKGFKNNRPYYEHISADFGLWYDNADQDDEIWCFTAKTQIGDADPDLYAYAQDPEARDVGDIKGAWHIANDQGEWHPAKGLQIVIASPSLNGSLAAPASQPAAAPNPQKPRVSRLHELSIEKPKETWWRACDHREAPKILSSMTRLFCEFGKMNRKIDRANERMDVVDTEMKALEAMEEDMREELEPKLDALERNAKKMSKAELQWKARAQREFDADDQKEIEELTAQLATLEKNFMDLCYDGNQQLGMKYMRQECLEKLYEQNKLEFASRKQLVEFLRAKRNQNFWMKGRGYIALKGNREALKGRAERVIRQMRGELRTPSPHRRRNKRKQLGKASQPQPKRNKRSERDQRYHNREKRKLSDPRSNRKKRAPKGNKSKKNRRKSMPSTPRRGKTRRKR